MPRHDPGMTPTGAILDCSDFESTVGSFAQALGEPPARVEARVRTFNRESFEVPWDQPPQDFAAAQMLELIDGSIAPEAFSAVYYFHGTRVSDPAVFFEHGILPVPASTDVVWKTLSDLAGERVADGEWTEFRSAFPGDCDEGGARSYPDKMALPLLQGPDAEMIRSALIAQDGGRHDYLSAPEIVTDIAWCAERRFGIDLYGEFQAATDAYIVKFRGDDVKAANLEAAAMFLIDEVEGELAHGWGGFDGHGVAIPPQLVVDVELIRSRG